MAVAIYDDIGTQIRIDATQRALRVTPRATDGNHFSFAATTGVLAALTTGDLFQLRWPSPSTVAVIRRVRVSAAVSTTVFTAGVPVELALSRITGWTAQGTGGTILTPTPVRSSMVTVVQSGDARIATTTGLGVGTRGAAPDVATLVAPGPLTGQPGIIFPAVTALWEAEVGDADHPLVLGLNEGLVVRAVAVPPAGTWRLSVQVSYAEVASY